MSKVRLHIQGQAITTEKTDIKRSFLSILCDILKSVSVGSSILL